MTENSGNTDIILSKTMKITCTDQDSNVLLVGGSGPGISSYIASNMLQAREVYVAADPGGSLYRQYSGFLKDMGYRVKCLDLIDFAENRTGRLCTISYTGRRKKFFKRARSPEKSRNRVGTG